MDYHIPSSDAVCSDGRPTTDAIAICGIGLRLPGGVCTTQNLWDLLINGRDARTTVTEGGQRFNPDGFDDSLGGKFSIRDQNGYFLSQDLSLFDPSFFSMGRKEAERCDPQQRLLLEVTRECLEDAGEVNYRGQRIGCYVGSFGSTWSRLQGMDPLFPNNYDMTGSEDYMLSNRISYEYDLSGPSMTINTACSASLVALHEACLALTHGSISGAIVGGACLQLSPLLSEMMALEGTLSIGGTSKSFDQSANGFARAEGITAVYLKRLEDAVEAGNPIRAVIRASAAGSDGNRPGLMQPQASTQEALMRHLYSSARLDPSHTAFVECHATGTPVGDPIEARAVDNVFGEHGVYVGSIKANIGHTEGSAGLASVIKAVLALEHKTIPPNIKLHTPNSKIPFGDRLMLPLVPTPFPSDKEERISINSFGIGGANSHVIIDSYTRSTAPKKRKPIKNGSTNGISYVNGDKLNGEIINGTSHGYVNGDANGVSNGHTRNRDTSHYLIPFSANTAHSLKQQTESYIEFVSQHRADLPNIAYTRALHRESLSHRSFAIFDPNGNMIRTSGIIKAPSTRGARQRVAMVFSGQGAQWVGMGRELLTAVPEFKTDLRTMDGVLQSLSKTSDWSLVDVISNPEADVARFNSAELSQPLCTALQIALLHHLRRLGVLPAAVVGHSSGEIAAAYAAGHISLAAAIKAAFFRGLVTTEPLARKDGGMAVIGWGSQQVSEWLSGGVVVACENSPSSTTISGNREEIKRVLASINAKSPEVFTRLLGVDMAYHSDHMALLGSRYLELLRTHTPSRDDIYFDRGADFISSSITSKFDPQALGMPEYWVHNLVEPVRFVGAIQALHASQGDTVLLEIGPHSTLRGPLRQIYDAKSWQLKYVAAQNRGDDSNVSFLSALGQLYQNDIEIDFRPLFKHACALSGLPTYPWDHTGPSFWHESRVSRAYRFRKDPRHCLLGLRSLDSPDTLPTWRNILEVEDVPWLLDHKVRSDTVFPFAGYIALAGEAIRQLGNLPRGFGYRLRHVVASAALMLKESSPIEITTSLRPKRLTDTETSTWFEFQIQSYDGSAWTEHCSGEVNAASPSSDNDHGIIQTGTKAPESGDISSSLPRRVLNTAFYRSMAGQGFRYGPEFALLGDITASTTEQLAHAHLIDTNDHCSAPFSLHPAEIDNCLHLIFVAATRGLCRRLDQLYLPTRIDELTVHRAGTSNMMLRAEIPDGDLNQCCIDCVAPGGEHILSLRGLQLTSLEDGESDALTVDKHGLARLEWHSAFEHEDTTKLLQPPLFRPDHCKAEQELAYLYMMEEFHALDSVEPSKPYFCILREWMKRTIEGGAFPLVDNPHMLARLEQTERRRLIDEYTATLKSGPCAPLTEACRRVSEHGVALFSGQRETIDILMQENLLTQVYNSISYDYSKFVYLLSKTKPNLRVLEVGAGTGGTTELILHELVRGNDAGLPSYSLYTYTDVSAGFFGKAKERFSYAPNMEFKVFDASRSPAEQDFENRKHWYDLVIAANVVHATPYIGETLSNIRSLLRPGGILLLTELLPTLKTISYIFGHFSGWWLGEADGRHDGPLLGIEEWDQKLKASGFSGANTIVYDAEEPYRQIVTIVSRAQCGAIDTAGGEKRVTLLCTDTASHVVCHLSERLEQEGWTVQPHALTNGPPSQTQPIISCIDLEPNYYSANLDEPSFQDLKGLMGSINTNTLWLMPPVQTGARHIRAAQFLGFARTLRSELGISLFTLEIDERDLIAHPELVIDVFAKIESETDTGALAPDMEYAVKDSRVLVPRFLPLTFKGEMERLKTNNSSDGDGIMKSLRIRKKGMLQTLYWQEKPIEPSLADDNVEVEIRAVGLNAYDILSAKSIINSEVSSEAFEFGCEASGVVRRVGASVTEFKVGDRVMTLTNGGCMATQIVVPSNLVFHIPGTTTFAEAATIPVCFGTVLYSLITVGRIEKGQSVLIHSACGGVGLTAVQVCRMLGAEVYLTVGNEEKVNYLMNTFGFPRERIFNSRDSSFVEGIMRETNGRGVDLVLNSLSGELLHASWNCVARFGTMVELGLRDLKGSGRLNMFPFAENRSYVGVEAIQFVERPDILKRQYDLFFASSQHDLLRPLQPLTVFPADKIEEAFRFLEDASHIGKVAVELTSQTISSVPHVEHVKFDPTKSYLLTGGTGGLGKSIAIWMVEHGARHLTFISRSAGTSDASKALFFELQTMGCSVTAVVGTVESIDSVNEAIQQSKHPIKGVLHLAMLLHDGPLMEMNWPEWQKAVEPKARGAWNLHSALLPQEQDLDFFFMSSSLLSTLSTSGQANYVAGNAVMEALCQYRHSLGLPAAVLNISAIEDIGFLTENEQAVQNIKSQGLMEVNERRFLECLELTILQCQADSQRHQPGESDCIEPWSNSSQLFMGLQTTEDLDDPKCRTMWRRDRRMGLYHNRVTSDTMVAPKGDALQEFLASIAGGDGMDLIKDQETVAFLAVQIGKKVNEYLLRPNQETDPQSSLTNMGLDSLLSVELARWFKSSFGIRMSVLEIVKHGTLSQLASTTVKKLLAYHAKGHVNGLSKTA
ncbi:putative Carrier domain-containing protein [Seiridium cardinale]|uniref:Carrier domain-containing protein n=1 Tax=Seiridium cardinale TaxID=138064 RepID=A0ABR2XAV3_9PEZI